MKILNITFFLVLVVFLNTSSANDTDKQNAIYEAILTKLKMDEEYRWKPFTRNIKVVVADNIFNRENNLVYEYGVYRNEGFRKINISTFNGGYRVMTEPYITGDLTKEETVHHNHPAIIVFNIGGSVWMWNTPSTKDGHNKTEEMSEQEYQKIKSTNPTLLSKKNGNCNSNIDNKKDNITVKNNKIYKCLNGKVRHFYYYTLTPDNALQLSDANNLTGAEYGGELWFYRRKR